MKTSIGSRWISWQTSRSYLAHLTCLTALAFLAAGCLQENSLSPGEAVAAANEPSPPPDTPAAPESIAQPPTGADAEEALAEADAQSLSNAPVKKISTEIEVPANLRPSPATAEIIKLANAGVEESVMLSFVTNSTGTFNLRAEEIIYLNDIGVPSRVVTAMLQRDHLLQAPSANLTITPSQPEVPTAPPPAYPPEQPFTASEPPPTIFDSTPDYNTGNYTTPVDTEPPPSDYADYYDALAPYGNWVDVGGVGQCWQPTVAIVNTGWRPYFNCGRWVYTDCGWYWMSDYSWGWAPFHYGRWFQHATLGWCWRPDRVWGPSWVCWRQSGDFCGWAPLPPGARFVAGIGLTFRGHPARHDFSFGLAANHFRFIPSSHFLDRDLARNVLPRDHANRIFQHSIVSTGIADHNHRVSNNGVPREHIASATRTRIIPATLHNVTPAEGVGIRERFERNGRTLAVYRPDLQPRIPSRTSISARQSQPSPNQIASRPTIQNHNRLATAPALPSQTSQPSAGVSGRADAPLRAGQPLILRGPDNPRQTAVPVLQNTRRAVPLNSVVIGQNRDPRVAAAQPEYRPNWNSRARNARSYNRDFSSGSSQSVPRNNDFRSESGPVQSARQPYWWAQPQQPRISDQSQFRHNREMPDRAAGSWSATAETPRYNPSPVRVPEYNRPVPVENHQSRPAPIESRPVPMESHQSHSAPVESHQSHSAPVESHVSHSAPAPSSPPSSSSSSSSSHSSSSQSSGRGR